MQIYDILELSRNINSEVLRSVLCNCTKWPDDSKDGHLSENCRMYLFKIRQDGNFYVEIANKSPEMSRTWNEVSGTFCKVLKYVWSI